jgi:hypothetical protein
MALQGHRNMFATKLSYNKNFSNKKTKKEVNSYEEKIV